MISKRIDFDGPTIDNRANNQKARKVTDVQKKNKKFGIYTC